MHLDEEDEEDIYEGGRYRWRCKGGCEDGY
jgi:hypothetical protein